MAKYKVLYDKANLVLPTGRMAKCGDVIDCSQYPEEWIAREVGAGRIVMAGGRSDVTNDPPENVLQRAARKVAGKGKSKAKPHVASGSPLVGSPKLGKGKKG